MKNTKNKILIACEESGRVRDAFRKRGFDAVSCDILPTRSKPEYHIQGDVLPLLRLPWLAVIAFPPCTDLASSGAKWFAEKRADGRQQKSAEFFMEFSRANSDFIAIENPVGVMSSKYRKPDQIIQPWQFGHQEQKKTCLWLKGFPLLVPTNNVKEKMLKLPRNVRERLHYLSPSPDRARIRSETFQGIAVAMAAQWGAFLKGE
jgi:hypothetical protein